MPGDKSGSVKYISSQFVYVNFENTDGINEGDTLFIKIKSRMKPALVVKYISSSSAACDRLLDGNINQDLTVYARSKNQQNNVTESEDPAINTSPKEVESKEEIKVSRKKDSDEPNTEFSGRYSIQSFTGVSNLNNKYDSQRWRHTLRLGVKNIAGSALSFSTYTMLAYRVDEWNSVSSNLGRALKVYDLSLTYRFSESSVMWVGRYLNNKISNISIVDGLQFENAFSFMTVGLVAGSRPNFTDFGLNSKLFEYGVYLNRADSIGNTMMENTISFFEQTNDFKTDRRFIYFQHRNNILSKTFLFVSTEIDLYKREMGVQKNDFSLTSLYLSARYAPINELSFNLSYDARKNVIYYETFKSLSDSILENEMRQGFRASALVRPLSNIMFGLQFGYRYSKTDLKPSRNYGGSFTFTTIPFIDISTTFDFNRLQSSYIDGYVYSVNLYKSLPYINSDFSLGFRKTDYTFTNSTLKLDEKAFMASFSTSIFHPISFSINYEGIFESIRTYGRIFFDITTRF